MSSISDQINRGREALKYFHNASVKYPAYNLSFNDLIDRVGGPEPKGSIFLEGLGFAYETLENDSQIDPGRLKLSMERLADKAQGRLPSSNQAFFGALRDEAITTNFLDAAAFVGLETAKSVGSGFVQVGEAVTDTLKSVGMIGPLVVVGALLYIVFVKVKRIA